LQVPEVSNLYEKVVILFVLYTRRRNPVPVSFFSSEVQKNY